MVTRRHQSAHKASPESSQGITRIVARHGKSGHKVAIPPSLLISAVGIVPDVRLCVTSDLKTDGSLLYMLGETKEELGGSTYYRIHGIKGNHPPGVALAGPSTARALHRAIVCGLVLAVHDCSEGGLAVALAEMAIGGELGAEVCLKAVPHANAREKLAELTKARESVQEAATKAVEEMQ